MKLFYCPQTRAVSARWALEEIGAPHELERLKFPEELNHPELLAANPLAQVPTLVDGEQVVTEAPAVALYLADRFPEAGLAPALDQRHEYYQWAFYALSSLDPTLNEYFAQTVRLPEGQRSPQRAEKARASAHKLLAVVDHHLSDRDYLLGGGFSMADVLMGSVLGWARMMNLLQDYAGIQAYLQRVMARPAFQRTIQD